MIQRYAPSTERGFTLVELMIGMVIGAIVMIGVAMFVANMGNRAASAENVQRMENASIGAIKMLEWDVHRAGVGFPLDIPGLSTVEVQKAPRPGIMDQIIRFSIADENNSNQPDELTLGGVGLDLTATGAKTGLVAQNILPGQLLAVRGADTTDVTYNYDPNSLHFIDPIDPTAFPNPLMQESMSILDHSDGWRSINPIPIQAVIDSPPGQLQINYDPSLISLGQSVNEGDTIFYHRPVPDGAGGTMSPWHVQQVRWEVQNEQLIRTPIPNPREPALTGAPIVVLDNVVDFQAAFLVWHCSQNQPVWVDHLLDEPAGTGYFSTASGEFNPSANAVGQRDRYLAMRERLIAIRITVLIREETPRNSIGASPPFNVLNDGSGNLAPVEIEDRTINGLDARYRYLPIQQIIDPVNLRIKTPMVNGQTFAPIRTAAFNQNTVTPGGWCSARQQ